MQQPEYVTRLIDTYTKAQASLVYTISKKEATGNLTAYERSLLTQVSQVLEETDGYALSWARSVIPMQYRRGVDDTVKDFASNGVSVGGFDTFSRLHTKAIDILVRNTIEDLTDATIFVGRQVRDVVRQAGLEAIGQKVATGATVKQTKLLVQQKLIAQGLNGIRDKRGRMISLDAYASTVARSTTREATNTATMNHTKALGYDLVQMSSHATSCPICGALQGRVYSLTGNTRGYPVLTQAFGSHANVHPNCRHVLLSYIPGLADDPEGDRIFSDRPFDIDPRSQAEIDRYNNQQRDLRKLREDKNQFQRYKLALGSDAPKTLSGFRRVKAADGERWQEMQSDYREVVK